MAASGPARGDSYRPRPTPSEMAIAARRGAARQMFRRNTPPHRCQFLRYRASQEVVFGPLPEEAPIYGDGRASVAPMMICPARPFLFFVVGFSGFCAGVRVSWPPFTARRHDGRAVGVEIAPAVYIGSQLLAGRSARLFPRIRLSAMRLADSVDPGRSHRAPCICSSIPGALVVAPLL